VMIFQINVNTNGYTGCKRNGKKNEGVQGQAIES